MNEKTRFIEIISIIKNSGIVKDFTPEKLKNTIMKLGPTFIKIGQILASRYDIIPEEYCKEFTKLRYDVEPMKFDDVIEILNEEIGNPYKIFANITEECIGAASIAQVHQAFLKTGEDVVIKVQRKNIYETMSMDIKLFKKAIKVLHLNLLIKMVNLNDIIDEIYNVTKEEMDFELEAKHIEEYRENNADIQYIAAPKVYEKFVTKKVLVMENIYGIDLNQKQKLIDLGYDLNEIGLKLANNYIKQALDDGFFHADPHQNNICIRDGKIVFLDFGMMGRISARNKNLLNRAMKAIVSNDVGELSRILLAISTSEGVDYSNLKNGIQKMLDKYADIDIENINIIDFTTNLSKLLRENNIRLDRNMTLLMRGICVIEGTLESISPNINLIMVFENKMKENDINGVFSKEMLLNTSRNIITGVNSLGEFPNELLTFVKDINRGETKFDIEMANSDKQVDKLEKMLHQMIIGLLDAAVLLGLGTVQVKALRIIYSLLAIVFTTWLFTQMAKDHFHKGY